jgi:urease accessory protein
VSAVPADVGHADVDVAAASRAAPVTTSVVRADAEIVATSSGRSTRVATLRNDPPLVLRRTSPGMLHLVSVGGGPVGGDALRLRIRLGTGAELVVRQVAATVALPSPTTNRASRFRVDVELGEGSSLHWIGQPVIAASGAEHVTSLRVQLARSARLCWREEMILGRAGEAGGVLRTEAHVVREGRPLLRSAAVLGDHGWDSAALGGSSRTSGTWLGIGQPPVPGSSEVVDRDVRGAVHRLDDGAHLVSALGDEHPPVRAFLDSSAPCRRHREQIGDCRRR